MREIAHSARDDRINLGASTLLPSSRRPISKQRGSGNIWGLLLLEGLTTETL